MGILILCNSDGDESPRGEKRGFGLQKFEIEIIFKEIADEEKMIR